MSHVQQLTISEYERGIFIDEQSSHIKDALRHVFSYNGTLIRGTL